MKANPATPLRKTPLYRKVNTRARNVHHSFGGDYRHARNTKSESGFEGTRTPMHGKRQRGLDYTPLFRFLLARVGEPWDLVFSEAIARLDRPDPVFWLVARQESERQDFVRVGESSYYSGLYLDAQGCLQIVNPALGPEKMVPTCRCCTHTFNGKPFGKPPTDASLYSGFAGPQKS